MDNNIKHTITYYYVTEMKWNKQKCYINELNNTKWTQHEHHGDKCTFSIELMSIWHYSRKFHFNILQFHVLIYMVVNQWIFRQRDCIKFSVGKGSHKRLLKGNYVVKIRYKVTAEALKCNLKYRVHITKRKQQPRETIILSLFKIYRCTEI